MYCTAPFNGISVNEQGKVRTCCRGTADILDLNKNTIAELKNSTILKEIQNSMLNGVPHELNCMWCHRHEQNTGDSVVRQYYNKNFPNISTERVKLQTIELRWSNLCNLGCLYCNPYYSSIWEDRLKIPIKTSKNKEYKDEVLTWVIDQIEDIKELQLVGGEPMLMKQNYALINQLPDDARLVIITNLSYDLQSIPCLSKLLSRPKENTIWNVSLDNIGEQFEYVRNGAKWSTLKNNLTFLSSNWPTTIGISFVYNLFSAFTIKETMQAMDEFGIKKFQFITVGRDNRSTVNHNNVISVFRLPTEIKKIAFAKFKDAVKWHQLSIHPEDLDFYPLQGANEILTQLELDTGHAVVSKKEFITGIEYFDSWNNKKFKDLWPEVSSLLELHLH